MMDQFQRALREHQAGRIEIAAEIYRCIVKRQPEHAGAWHLLGVALQQQGQIELALEYIARAVALDASKAVYHNNLGVALRAAGRLADARETLRRALAINPSYADAISNLALVLYELGDSLAAMEMFERALECNPHHADALYNFANLLYEQGQSDLAVDFYRRAIAVQPGRAELYNNLGNAWMFLRRPEAAAECYREALAAAPGYAEACGNLGHALADLERHEEARQAYAEAARLQPGQPLWRWASLRLCPTVFGSNAELEEHRRELERQLDACLAAETSIPSEDLDRQGFPPPFNLSHHGRNNRRLKEKYAALFAPHVPRYPLARRVGKPRIGFLVTAGHEGGFLRGSRGIIERLDARFRPVVLCSAAVLPTCRAAIKRMDIEWVPLPVRLRAAAELVAAAGCDVLYHWQIGTDSLNYLLPMARAARVQCTSWGTHVTSGIDAVDYYLSSELIEIPGAEAHYTETLVRLPTLPTYQPRVPKPHPARRSDLGLPERGTCYMFPQRLAKLHPDFDPLIARILDGDPGGYLVLLRGPREQTFQMLQARWTRTLGSAVRRVIPFPLQKTADYNRLVAIADVVLDAPHYSAGLSSYDIFSFGVPLVTLPGEFHVSRYALGCYRKMGLEHLVPSTDDEYVALAVQLGTDLPYRAAIAASITERSDVLFEDAEAVRAHEDFFDRAIEKSVPLAD